MGRSAVENFRDFPLDFKRRSGTAGQQRPVAAACAYVHRNVFDSLKACAVERATW
jgi:hypothetical protein